MNQIKVKITSELDGKTIKEILFRELKLSQRIVTDLKKDNGIMLNGEKKTVRAVVCIGDELILTPQEKQSENIVPNNIALDIIYEDEDIIVINKPSDMPTHPSHNHFENTLANAVMYYFRDKSFVFRAITRLDKDTTGLVLIAKNQFAASKLSKQMRENKIEKKYVAICIGEFLEKSGIIEAPIMREKESVIKRIVSENGQYARTDYTVLAYREGYSLVELNPKTGRTHQIRVHMSHLGHPLYSDFIYGEEINGERTRLHCKSLSFYHPVTNERCEFLSPVPNDFFIS